MASRTPEMPVGRMYWWAVAVLLCLWVVAVAMRTLWMGQDVAAPEDRLWEVVLTVRTDSIPSGTVARVAVPADTEHLRVTGQRLFHPGWQLRFSPDPDWGVGRQMRLVASRSGIRGFELGFTVHQSAAPLMQLPSLPHALSAEERDRYLRSSPLLGLEHPVVAGEAGLIGSGSESNAEILGRIFGRARQLLPGGSSETRQVPEVLASGRAGELERAYVMVALCRAANIPARLVTGMVVASATETGLHHWVEVWRGAEGWLAFDPGRGYRRGVPEFFLPFVWDRADLVEVDGTGRLSVGYSVTSADEFLDTRAGADTGWTSVFHLTRLPLEVRNVLGHLFLLPLAVLLTTLFRALSGIRSYGTFMPALFALGLVHAQWQLAVVTLGLVLMFAVLGRAALPRRLQPRPRLTVVLILVVVGVAGSLSLMEYLAWGQDGGVVLLPVVIMAILVDLFYRALEKEGAEAAAVRLFWTLFQVVLCLPVMQYEALGHWLVSNPETHLLTLAAALLVSAYHGPDMNGSPPSARKRKAAAKPGPRDAG